MLNPPSSRFVTKSLGFSIIVICDFKYIFIYLVFYNHMCYNVCLCVCVCVCVRVCVCGGGGGVCKCFLPWEYFVVPALHLDLIFFLDCVRIIIILLINVLSPQIIPIAGPRAKDLLLYLHPHKVLYSTQICSVFQIQVEQKSQSLVPLIEGWRFYTYIHIYRCISIN